MEYIEVKTLKNINSIEINNLDYNRSEINENIHLKESFEIEKNDDTNIMTFKFYLTNLLPNIACATTYFILSALERIFTAREGSDLVTGVSLGNIFSAYICLNPGYALSDTIGVIAAKYFGERNFYLIGQTRNLIAIMILILCLLYSIFAFLFPLPLLKLVTTQSFKIIRTATDYIKYTVPKLFFELESFVLKCYFESHLFFIPTWITIISGIALYPLFAYIFITRLKMGSLGAAIAFTIDSFLKFSIFLVINFFFNPHPQSNVYINSNTFDWNLVKKTIKISFLNTVSILSELFGWFIILIFASRLENRQYSLFVLLETLFLINLGFSFGWMQTDIYLIGNYLGENRPDLIRKTIKYNFMSVCLIYLPLIILFIIFRNQILRNLSDDENILNFPNISFLIILIIIVVMLEFILYVLSGFLKGLGEVKFTSTLNFVFLFFINPIFSYILAFVFNFQIFGIFYSLLIIYIILDIIYLIKFFFFIDIEGICENYHKNHLISIENDKEE